MAQSALRLKLSLYRVVLNPDDDQSNTEPQAEGYVIAESPSEALELFTSAQPVAEKSQETTDPTHNYYVETISDELILRPSALEEIVRKWGTKTTASSGELHMG